MPALLAADGVTVRPGDGWAPSRGPAIRLPPPFVLCVAACLILVFLIMADKTVRAVGRAEQRVIPRP